MASRNGEGENGIKIGVSSFPSPAPAQKNKEVTTPETSAVGAMPPNQPAAVQLPTGPKTRFVFNYLIPGILSHARTFVPGDISAVVSSL